MVGEASSLSRLEVSSLSGVVSPPELVSGGVLVFREVDGMTAGVGGRGRGRGCLRRSSVPRAVGGGARP